MGFWKLLELASMPILEVLIISGVGAYIATPYCYLLGPESRKSLNKLVFLLFTPALMFASLARKVTLEDIISWWFMPVNIGIIFLVGGILGNILVKLLKPQKQQEGLVVACSSAGNLGNLMLIMVGAICEETGTPFGETAICTSNGLAYASFSMALGGFYIWTYTYHIMRASSLACKDGVGDEVKAAKINGTIPTLNNGVKNTKGDLENPLLIEDDPQRSKLDSIKEDESLLISLQRTSCRGKVKAFLHQILEELLSPPMVAAVVGLLFGATKWLRNLIIGDTAPLRVFQSAITILGDGTIPCITLILGANLTQGLRSARVHWGVIIGVIIVRYVILPLVGIGVVQGAGHLGLLPLDPLFRYVLMIQFTLPPAMNISTMAELFDIGKEDCSVIFLWSYLASVLALTVWSTIYMWVLA